MKTSENFRVDYKQIEYSRVNDEKGNTVITARIKITDSRLSEPYYETIRCIVDTEGNGKFSGKPRFIPSDFFKSFKKLRTVLIPKCVETIQSGAFFNCKSLYRVDFEKDSTLKRINSNSFEGTESLYEIKLPNQVNTIELRAFCKSRIKEIDLSNCSIDTLDRRVFFNCKRLETVRLPKRINRICHNCFEGCAKLRNVYSSKGIGEIAIETDAFKDCSSFEGIREIIIETDEFKENSLCEKIVNGTDVCDDCRSFGEIESYNDISEFESSNEHGNISLEQVGKIIVSAKSKTVKLVTQNKEGYQVYIIPSEIYKANENIRKALFEVQKKSKISEKEIEN